MIGVEQIGDDGQTGKRAADRVAKRASRHNAYAGGDLLEQTRVRTRAAPDRRGPRSLGRIAVRIAHATVPGVFKCVLTVSGRCGVGSRAFVLSDETLRGCAPGALVDAIRCRDRRGASKSGPRRTTIP